MPEPVKGQGRYMPGLDGLRALAVLGVIAYHLHLPWVPGGLLGVGVFFVLSGYLITDLLVAGWERRGRMGLKDFWLRRARRLLPALWLMLVVVIAWCTLFDRVELASLREDALAAFFYVSNWWFIFHHVSYFARFGPPSPLGHLWSLAVEEQFYLLWPLCLGWGLWKIRRRGWLITWVLVAALASALAMALIYQPGTDPSRVYYGTDTRAFALFIGAALALFWPSAKLTQSLAPARRRWLDAVGGLGLATVLVMMWQTNQYQTFLYRGGLVVLSVATACTIAAVAHPASWLSRILGYKPLRWLGVRSYGIYLWHYPVIILTSPVASTGLHPVRAGLQVGASIVFAALSWRYLEQPIRHGGLGRWWQQVRTGSRSAVSPRHWAALAGSLGILTLCVVGWATPIRVAAASGPVPKGTSSATPTPLRLGNSGQVSPTGDPPTTAPATRVPRAVYRPTPSSLTVASGRGVTAIGDSVMVDAAPYLRKLLPGIVIQAKVGRQLIKTPPVIARLKKAGELGPRAVIIELGTNGPFTATQLQQLLTSLGPVHQIILVNTRVPRPWQNVVNHTLAQVAAHMPRVTLVNWYAASAGKTGYFYPDHVHLNPKGAAYYAGLLARAVSPHVVPSSVGP